MRYMNKYLDNIHCIVVPVALTYLLGKTFRVKLRTLVYSIGRIDIETNFMTFFRYVFACTAWEIAVCSF